MKFRSSEELNVVIINFIIQILLERNSTILEDLLSKYDYLQNEIVAHLINTGYKEEMKDIGNSLVKLLINSSEDKLLMCYYLLYNMAAKGRDYYKDAYKAVLEATHEITKLSYPEIILEIYNLGENKALFTKNTILLDSALELVDEEVDWSILLGKIPNFEAWTRKNFTENV